MPRLPQSANAATVAIAPHIRAGRAAEEAAAAWLAAQGVLILDRNVRVPGGEIDILAQHGQRLLFVEVRWRRDDRFGGACASIGRQKRQRLHRAALSWLLQQRQQQVMPRDGQPYHELPCRIDALCRDGNGPAGWNWIQGI